MTLFHIPTAFMLVGLLYFVMPTVTWVVLSSRRSPAVALWCGGDISFGLGVILLGLRGHVPEWATFPLANLLMFIAVILHIQSLRLDLAVPWRTMWMALAALLYVLGFEGIRRGLGDALLRLQYTQSVWVVMYGYIAVLAWRIGRLERSRSARWIAGVLLLLVVAFIYSVIRLSIGLSPPDPLNSNPSNIFLALAGTLAAVIGNIAYVGLAFERSQRRTAEAERQYHAIIETTVDGFYSCDVDGRFTDVNRAFCQMLGYSREELLCMKVHDVEANETGDEMSAHVRHIMIKGSDRFETRYRCKENQLLHVELSVNFQPINAGNFLVFARDISERKQVENTLIASEELLREMSRVAKVGGWNLDLKTNKLTWTEETYRIHEVEPHFQPQLEDGINYYASDARPILKEAIERAMTVGDSFDLELPFITARDNHLWVRSIGKTDRVNGQIVRLYGIFQDITERKATERQLLLTQFAMEQFADEVYIIRDDTSFQYVNDAVCRMLEYGREELMSMNLMDIDPFFNNKAEAVVCWQAVKDAGSITLESLHRSRSGRVYPVEIHNNFIEYEGEGYVCSISHDITERKKAEEALRESEAKFRLAFNNANTGMCLVDLQGKLLEVNEKMSEIFGYSQCELESMSVNDLTLPEDASLSPDFIHHAVQGDGDSATFEKRYRHRQGHIIHGQVSSSLVRDSQGQPRYFISQVQDITERKLAEIAIRESEEKFKALADTSPLAIYMSAGIEQKYEYINPTALRLFGYTMDETPTVEQWWPLAYPDETYRRQIEEEWQQRIQDAIATSSEIEPMEVVVTCKDGSHKIIQWGFKSIDKQNWAFGLDLTERKQAEDEIKQLAFYDPLTQLPNRRLLLDRLHQAMVACVRSKLYGALLFIDLDNFKTLNDTLGHDQGDLLLQEVASRLTTCVRECDTVARLGGDEFVVMLIGFDACPEEAAAQSQKIGMKILDKLNQKYQLTGHEQYFSASIGINLFDGHSLSVNELLKQADIALYQAKSDGRNTLRFFDPGMQSSMLARVELTHDLRLALRKNQFKLFCQTEVGHDQNIIGVEVLLRWQHPERGLISPNEFIPLAEETGLIQSIGHWVLESACTVLKAWEGLPHLQNVHLAVNISVRQFHQANFVERVLEVVRHSGIDLDKLMLELTENVVLADLDDAVAKMNALKDFGVRFSLDDFGTGYSSLAYLTRLPFDQLKIDRSFVENIGVKPSDAIIIQTIIAMASQLGIDVIAEGVETETQRDFLYQQGCLVCQGYLFGKPMPLADLSDTRLLP